MGNWVVNQVSPPVSDVPKFRTERKGRKRERWEGGKGNGMERRKDGWIVRCMK